MATAVTDPETVHELFTHVRSVIGVILGLSIGRLLGGVAQLIEHPRTRKIWWVHLGWVLWAIIFVISFWWWEFHLIQIRHWTLGKYFFLFAYTGLYFILCSILFPTSFEGHEGYKSYLISRRYWFFSFMALIAISDLGDGLLKGVDYVASLGPRYIIHLSMMLTLSLAGALSRRPAIHAAVLILALIELLNWSFAAYDQLF